MGRDLVIMLENASVMMDISARIAAAPVMHKHTALEMVCVQKMGLVFAMKASLGTTVLLLVTQLTTARAMDSALQEMVPALVVHGLQARTVGPKVRCAVSLFLFLSMSIGFSLPQVNLVHFLVVLWLLRQSIQTHPFSRSR